MKEKLYSQKFREALHYLIGGKLSNIPDFSVVGPTVPTFYAAVEAYLMDQFRYGQTQMMLSSNNSLEEVLNYMEKVGTNVAYLLTGKDKDENKCVVVGMGDEILFNPEEGIEIVQSLHSGWHVLIVTVGVVRMSIS